jgi:hypothetical protein
MNNWHNDFMAEYHRQDILNEVEQIHLERLAVNSRVYRPGFFARTMYNFANWMISTGKQLRERYEIPCPECPTPTGSFAR